MPINGQVSLAPGLTNGEYIKGSMVSFTCNSGYKLNGADVAICQDAGDWNVQLPTCSLGNQSNILYTKILIHSHVVAISFPLLPHFCY